MLLSRSDLCASPCPQRYRTVDAYGPVSGPTTEETPIRPTTKKGGIRADALAALMRAEDDGLQVSVARSADFYGPGATTSMFNSMVLDAIAAGKRPTWMLNATLPHSMTYTPDIGTALAILGTDPRGFGGVWHVPTAPALTGQEYIALASKDGAAFTVMSKSTLRMGGLFIRVARESLELSYQNSEPYTFDSTKFESTLGVGPTPYSEGIASSLAFTG